MTNSEYELLQAMLKRQLQSCHGLTGYRREGFKEGIKVAMSVLHGVKERDTK